MSDELEKKPGEKLAYRRPDGTLKPGNPYAWKPGKPPGPGRPKGRDIWHDINKLLSQDVVKIVQPDGTTFSFEPERDLPRVFAAKLLEGDYKFWKEYIDRASGPIAQMVHASFQAHGNILEAIPQERRVAIMKHALKKLEASGGALMAPEDEAVIDEDGNIVEVELDTE